MDSTSVRRRRQHPRPRDCRAARQVDRLRRPRDRKSGKGSASALGESDAAGEQLLASFGVGAGAQQCRISKKLFFLSVLELKEDAGDGEYKFKVVTVGDSAVGKSCLLTRFVQDYYSDFHVATVGMDFKSVVTMSKGKHVTLQLWDTAGQERFSGVTGSYYRSADCFVMVFDATRQETFDHITEIWLKNIKENHDCGPGTEWLLIGNKYDLADLVVVSEETAAATAAALGATFVATSAKTAANVDSAFLSAAGRLVETRRAAAQSRSRGLSGGPAARQSASQPISLSSASAAQPDSTSYVSCGGCSLGPAQPSIASGSTGGDARAASEAKRPPRATPTWAGQPHNNANDGGQAGGGTLGDGSHPKRSESSSGGGGDGGGGGGGQERRGSGGRVKEDDAQQQHESANLIT
eukprot:Selendium_serpulae@DN3887_c0_g1_i3.p1